MSDKEISIRGVWRSALLDGRRISGDLQLFQLLTLLTLREKKSFPDPAQCRKLTSSTSAVPSARSSSQVL